MPENDDLIAHVEAAKTALDQIPDDFCKSTYEFHVERTAQVRNELARQMGTPLPDDDLAQALFAEAELARVREVGWYAAAAFHYKDYEAIWEQLAALNGMSVRDYRNHLVKQRAAERRSA